ncbi:PLD nuclease N-terminal domain-containing protein [Pseudomonas lundensis]|uniref:PLDc N-terminal domain-containing protein n=1 Tax=Pseudomonas lundensis TaxID=86185 RepID=UPI0014726C50|nr:PLD nuclease N-terminal domain-containing protein [Pseudomonas lundensis]MCT8951443.1 PLD nuclease N-terminal domain-containing protein [Pseudomonas lundensis]NNA35792.1 PLDc_N domain-containing protein [Pseudomonas lundensis]
MQIEYIWVALAIVVLLLELWAIKSVLKSGANVNSRCMWVAVLIFVPLLGLVAWLIAGPKQLTSDGSTPS